MQRFDIKATQGGGLDIQETPFGDWVEWSSVEDLIFHSNTLAVENHLLLDSRDKMMKQLNAMMDEAKQDISSIEDFTKGE